MPTTVRQAYFDCASGASGEMILGALISAGLLEPTCATWSRRCSAPGPPST